jgi:hypothetical protein
MSGSQEAAAPAAAARLARLHLRTGLLRLARVELEELAGEGGLDTDGVLDLAEARWRTGDLRGAAEAAGAWLEGAATVTAAAGDDREVDPAGAHRARGRADALAHALIADWLAVRGRDDDAAAHVSATLDVLADGPTGSTAADLDALFCGIPPRSDAWPSFGPGDAGRELADGAAGGEPVVRVFTPPMGPAVSDPIVAAAERLCAGDDAAAAVLLVLALRATPSRAGEILERADSALAARPGAALLLVRAEALRALGRHEAASIAYAVADTHARHGGPAPSSAPDAAAIDRTDAAAAAPDAASVPDPEWSPP